MEEEGAGVAVAHQGEEGADLEEHQAAEEEEDAAGEDSKEAKLLLLNHIVMKEFL